MEQQWNISGIRRMQQMMDNAIKHLKEEISKRLDNIEPLPGVKKIESEGKLPYYTVSSSALFCNPNFYLTPYYYIPEKQAEVIKKYILKDGLSIDEIIERVDELINSGKVKVGRDITPLNPNTLLKLREIKKELLV